MKTPIKLTHILPSSISDSPTIETLKAMGDAENNINLTEYDSPEHFFEQQGIDIHDKRPHV